MPIRSMSLARCDRITDAAVGELCDTFTSLQRVDLTRCVEVGDAAMTRLAAYTRQLEGSGSAAGSSSDEEEEEQEEEEEDELQQAQAAVEAVGSMHLAEAASPLPAAGTTSGKAVESPDSAVRRIAAQRHAAMLARSAREGAQLLRAALHGQCCVGWCFGFLMAFSWLLLPLSMVHWSRAWQCWPFAVQHALSTGGRGTWACMSWCSRRPQCRPGAPSSCCSRAAPPARACGCGRARQGTERRIRTGCPRQPAHLVSQLCFTRSWHLRSPALQVLDVSRCPNIAGDALDIHPRCVLETLRAAGCNGLRSVVIQLPTEAPLRSLNLENCRQLNEVGWGLLWGRHGMAHLH